VRRSQGATHEIADRVGIEVCFASGSTEIAQ